MEWRDGEAQKTKKKERKVVSGAKQIGFIGNNYFVY